jgi:predicted ATPase with chaperone activity
MQEIQPELMDIMREPKAIGNLGVPQKLVVDLIYRLLFNEGNVQISRFSEVLKIPPHIADSQLAHMKYEHLVEIAKAGSLGPLSYTYRLTEKGLERAKDAAEKSQYTDAVPVSIEAYSQAILLQTQRREKISPESVKNAISHLILPDNFHRRIGPAVNAASSLFLYGPPGNGKTTVAQIVGELLAGSDPIWLPYSISIGGQIIKLIDPLYHEPVEFEHDTQNGKDKVDMRWGLFKRPAIMVGGELTMDALDLRYEESAKFYEAPLQLKANGGMFLIDDFGRQPMSPQELLNRWIVPLESEIDFLRLRTGQTLEFPFRQLIVFSTNLDPAELVDGAFLRRIQIKVEVDGPDEKMFYQIFSIMCKHYKVPFDKDGFLYLVRRWFREANRVMQAVHPRDILKALVALCDYEGIDPQLTPNLIDEACQSYFVDMNREKSWAMAGTD